MPPQESNCEHDWEQCPGHAEHRFRCRKCGVLSYLHERHRKRGREHNVFRCGYTTMQDLGDGEKLKRRPACDRPAVAWHGELCYCREHVPIPRGMQEEERRLKVERQADEHAAQVRASAALESQRARLEFASVARPIVASVADQASDAPTGTIFW